MTVIHLSEVGDVTDNGQSYIGIPLFSIQIDEVQANSQQLYECEPSPIFRHLHQGENYDIEDHHGDVRSQKFSFFSIRPSVASSCHALSRPTGDHSSYCHWPSRCLPAPIHIERNVLVQGVPLHRCRVKTRSMTVNILYSIVSTAGEASRAACICYFNGFRVLCAAILPALPAMRGILSKVLTHS
jgi:hypothetical protein